LGNRLFGLAQVVHELAEVDLFLGAVGARLSPGRHLKADHHAESHNDDLDEDREPVLTPHSVRHPSDHEAAARWARRGRDGFGRGHDWKLRDRPN